MSWPPNNTAPKTKHPADACLRSVLAEASAAVTSPIAVDGEAGASSDARPTHPRAGSTGVGAWLSGGALRRHRWRTEPGAWVTDGAIHHRDGMGGADRSHCAARTSAKCNRSCGTLALEKSVTEDPQYSTRTLIKNNNMCLHPIIVCACGLASPALRSRRSRLWREGETGHQPIP
eukprot:scaffold1399_cov410-Prasinococcus_capsulatus_cf.AAC.36